MEERNNAVSFVAFESMKSTMERTIKRLLILAIILVILLFGSNAAWIWYEAQWETIETVTQEVTQEAETGSNHFVGGDYYGQATDKDNAN